MGSLGKGMSLIVARSSKQGGIGFKGDLVSMCDGFALESFACDGNGLTPFPFQALVDQT